MSVAGVKSDSVFGVEIVDGKAFTHPFIAYSQLVSARFAVSEEAGRLMIETMSPALKQDYDRDLRRFRKGEGA